MAIEKLSDSSRTLIEKTPFTQISNEVILNIKDNDSFRVYCYLQSKSQNWKVIKEDVKNICKIGDRKLKQVFSYLNRSNLIQYIQIIDDNGKFIKTDIVVKNGLCFNKNEPFQALKKQNLKLSTEKNPGGAETARAVLRTCGNEGLLNKDLTKKIKKQNKILFDQEKNKDVDKSSQAMRGTCYIERNTISDDYKNTKKGSINSEQYKNFVMTSPIMRKKKETLDKKKSIS